MIMGMAMLAILVAMLTVRAEVGGLPLQQERYRRFQPGGGWGVGPGGGAGPGGPTTSPSTPGASPTNKPSNPGPQGPGGGSPLGIDTSGDPSGLKGETPTGATPQYPYYKKWRLDKELGDKLYAWNSTPNTVYDYPRVEAVLQTHVSTKFRTLICYVDECSEEYLNLENNTDYTYTRVYLRDIRPGSGIRVNHIDLSSPVIYFSSNDNQNGSDIDLPYLESRELIWTIEFDEPTKILIKISDINLGDSDTHPHCHKDYLILYDPDNLNPTVFCTNVTNPSIHPFDNITKFIIRFTSDEDITYPRGFRGSILIINNISETSQFKRSIRSTEKRKDNEEEEEEEEEEEGEEEEVEEMEEEVEEVKEEVEVEEEEVEKVVKEEVEEEEMDVEVVEVEGVSAKGILGAVPEQSEKLKILETCVDEILVFGVEAAAMYADHVVCAPASKSYFHYILNRCIRHD